MDSTASSLSLVPRFVESEADNDPTKNHEGAGEMKPSEPFNAPLGSKPSKGRLGSVTSKVWEHYIKLPCANRYEQTASCKYCNKELKCPSTSGTSALHNHLSRCSKYPLNSVDNKQTTLTFKAIAGDDSSSGSTLGTWKFDKMLCRKYCARMLVMDELPFRVVEHEGFRDFCSVMQPRFEVPSRFTIAKDCYDLFLTEKESFFNYLKKSKVRVCLTTDIWISRQNLSYMCLTVHFIDREWKLHKRLLNFTLIPNHSGNVIGRCIEKHLLEWGIDKVLTITVDNATSNDVGIKYVKKSLNNWTKSVLSCNHLHLRCTAHIFNLVVKDGLKDLCDPIFRIRSAGRYVRSSPARLQRFKICVEQEKIESKSLVSLDCETRWNSTYLMLECAVKFERAFDRLEEQDDKYRSELIPDKNKGLPLSTDWEYVRALLPFLKCFFDSTLSVSGSLYVTSNLFVSVVFGVGLQIKGQLTHASPIVREMAVRMKEKYDKYFGNVNNINPFLFITVVLDPRLKLGVVKFLIDEVYDEARTKILGDRIEDTLNAMFQQYSANVATSGGSVSEERSSNSQRLSTISEDSSISTVDVNAILEMYKKRRLAEQSEEGRSELQSYLVEKEKFTAKESTNFDVLLWWKVNGYKYPTLALMARDVLAIPVSTVASESAFSTGGRVLDPFRSSLTPKMVEALVCGQNWLRSKPISEDDEDQIDVWESIETDFREFILNETRMVIDD